VTPLQSAILLLLKVPPIDIDFLWRFPQMIPFQCVGKGPQWTRKQERDLSCGKLVCRLIAAVGLLLTAAPLALAQSTPRPEQDRMLKNGPPIWDANRDGVYTCDEWKVFAARIFASADRNRDGRLDPAEFATVQKADATLGQQLARRHRSLRQGLPDVHGWRFPSPPQPACREWTGSFRSDSFATEETLV
jgi:hypothetical protein